MKKLLIPLLFATTLFAHSQTIYTIPWATQQPKFVFPIYFEEGGGQKDTLYIGYDSTADGGMVGILQDTIFGVKKMYIDTTRFYACWSQSLTNGNQLIDSVYKANVSQTYINNAGYQFFPGNSLILVNNGVLPLKISWDKSLFYSDSLPFAHYPPAPGAEGRLIINYGSDTQISENGYVDANYFNFYNTLITDSIVLSWSTVMDSVTIANTHSLSVPVQYGYIELNIQEWTGILVNVNIIYEEKVVVYPNPFINNININLEELYDLNCQLSIYDLQGHKLKGMSLMLERNLNLELNNLSRGIYLLELSNKDFSIHKMIIKL